MAEPAKRNATYADLMAVPSHMKAEIIFGTLVTHPRPVNRHTTAAGRLGAKLVNRFEFGDDDTPGDWVFMPEPELRLGPHIVSPDIAGWRVERLPEGYGESAFMDVAPDWVCEILSPRTEATDRVEKRRIYATYGVAYLWFLDPRSRHLEVFSRQNAEWLLTHTFAETETVCAPPFTDLRFVLSSLWPFPRPSDPGE